jgi:osomolarity two-component system response regulator SSK1
MKPFQFGAPSTDANGTAKFIPSHGNSINSSFFTNKRVWVKVANGNPTTIVVHHNDIVDDLKSAIVAKYPNTIGRTYDSADLLIKLAIPSRSSGNNAPTTKKSSLSVSPDRKSPIFAQFHAPSSIRYITLESDQNVYAIIDSYFPNGMSINDALMIELPISHHQGDQQSQSSSMAHTSPQVQVKTLVPQTHSPSYYQPKPQYTANHRHHHLNSSGSIHNFNAYEETSVSPAPVTAVNKASPLLRPQPSPVSNAVVHRRSQSNPPQSPASQAVLLLPKNFSLTNSNNANSAGGLSKKRLSLDENQVKEIRRADSLGSTHNDDISLNTEAIKPFPMSSTRKSKTLPKLNISDVSVISESASSEMLSSSSGGPSAPVSGLPVPKGYQQLNSPSRTPVTATSKSKLLLEEAVQKSEKDYENRSHKDNNDSDPVEQNKSTETVTNSMVATTSKRNGKVTCDGENGKPSSESLRLNPRATTTEKVLPSISVLVVEDNAINQAILGAFLRRHKIHYQIAKNGQEAIDKWRKGGFHLVLMDIQLPVKSGIEATKAIRQLEKINGIGVFAQSEFNNTTLPEVLDDEKLDLRVFRSPVIIVALTASSNSSVDRQNALMAGCNDYLTKPVNLVWLQNKITEWGCMQALIDFEGWKSKSATFQLNKQKNPAKAIA